ncbi:MAG: AMP-binding protein [Chloroflexi bacterium]|nr:AMP-binding protein [Chloroflexota bacterium]
MRGRCAPFAARCARVSTCRSRRDSASKLGWRSSYDLRVVRSQYQTVQAPNSTPGGFPVNLMELLEIPASLFPEREILRFQGRGVTYGELQERVAKTAGALRTLGVQTGDRLAILQTNTPAVVELLYAAASLGVVFVPLNFRASREELSSMLARVEPTVVLVGDRYRSTAAELRASTLGAPVFITLDSTTGPGIAGGPQRAEMPSLGILVDQAEPAARADIDDNSLAAVLFTSGTTAGPKGVMLAHAGLTSFVLESAELCDGADRGAVLVAAPLHHVAGLTAVLAATFAGRRIVLMEQFEAEGWLRLVATEGITHVFLVPTMLKRVLDHPTFAETDLSGLQVLSYGAAPMPLAVIRRAIAALPRSVHLISAFGQTETASTVAVLGPEDHRLEGTPDDVQRHLRRLASIGRPIPDVELRILDDDGTSLPPGKVGEIAIRADRLMRGYYQQDEATQETLRDGWLRTRDLAWVDEDGYIYLAGRKGDLIIHGGENIAPAEVETVLESHPAVEEAGVFGIPDEEWGERVAAVVVPRPGAEIHPDALIDFCRQRLAGFKRPEVVFVADPSSDGLPRNTLGKLLRGELRARYAT